MKDNEAVYDDVNDKIIKIVIRFNIGLFYGKKYL